MANKRLFLVHQPSGHAVYLGKRMGWGWYDVHPDTARRLQWLYDRIESQEAEGDQDAFVLDCSDGSGIEYTLVKEAPSHHE